MQYLIPTLALSLALVGCAANSAENTLPPTTPEQVDAGGAPTGLLVEENIVYSEPGTPVSYTSLDIYRRSGQTPGPILVFVHGGSWMSGDKANVGMSAGLVDYYINRGYSFVAINHRLQNNTETPGTDYADQATDIAAALAWVRANSERVGGLPEEIVLMGFSSGAHLVSLVATDPSYLALHQIRPTDLAGIIPLDVSAYDIPRAIEEACDQGFCRSVQNLPRIFGADIAEQRLASPVHHITANSSPFSLFLPRSTWASSTL